MRSKNIHSHSTRFANADKVLVNKVNTHKYGLMLFRIIENKAQFNNISWKHSKFTNKMSRFALKIHRVLSPLVNARQKIKRQKNQGRNKDFNKEEIRFGGQNI